MEERMNPQTTQGDMKTTKEKLTLVAKAYKALEHVFYSKMRNHAEETLKVAISEEKQHRGFGSDFAAYHPAAATVNQCAKMFVVKRVADYISGERLPDLKDYFHTQQSAFMCAAIALEFGDEVRQAWAAFDIRELAAFDYVEFVGRVKVAA